VEDSIKQALLGRFSAWLDTAPAPPGPPDDAPEGQSPMGQSSAGQLQEEKSPDGAVPDRPLPAAAVGEADLFSVFVELAGLRSEVRTESRLVKEALDQFRAVFDALQASQATLQRELERARAETREQSRATLRPLLLDIIDLRDRLLAALAAPAPPPPDVSPGGAAGVWRRLWRSRPGYDRSGYDRSGYDRSGQDRSATGGIAAWQDGVRMILRRLDQVLADRRVVAVALLGRPYDARLARVVGTEADPAAAAGTVLEEVRPGFLWDDQVLRSAEVIVCKGAATGELP
jgi:molecular chaperone GrpE